MDTVNIGPLKTVLQHKLLAQYSEFCDKPMNKEIFLHGLWDGLASFVQQNSSNSLMQSAVVEHRNGGLIPHAFLILSVLYGSYSYQPSKARILKDFISMLDEDFDGKELRACKYATRKETAGSFFPELYRVWADICEIYDAVGFGHETLPRTPYHAYSLFVLNRPQDFDWKMRHKAIFTELLALYRPTLGTVTLAKTEERPSLTIVK